LIAARLPKSLTLPATSSNTASGGERLTVDVSLSAHADSDSRLARSRRIERSNTRNDAASANAAFSLTPGTMPQLRADRLVATT
jgi:hypothetical protein